MVKNLLQDAEVPESYVEAYDILSTSEHKVAGGRIRTKGIQEVLRRSVTIQAEQDKIWRLVSKGSGETELGRGEFNVLLALIGLAQEGDELSLDAVDERRKGE